MKPEHASFPTLTQLRRWLMWSWCVCFLGVSLIAPVSAALMVGSSQIGTAGTFMNHHMATDDSVPNAHASQHHGEDTMYCDSCTQDVNCLGNCLHCSACNFTVVFAPVLSLFNTPVRVAEHVPSIRVIALPNPQSSPPYRPPITHR